MKKLFLIIFSFFFCISSTFALHTSRPRIDSGGDTDTGYTKWPHDSLNESGWGAGNPVDGYEYTCTYYYKVYDNTAIEAFAYSKDGKELSESAVDEKILAGTSIGLYVSEKHTRGYNIHVDFDYKNVGSSGGYFTCTYEKEKTITLGGYTYSTGTFDFCTTTRLCEYSGCLVSSTRCPGYTLVSKNDRSKACADNSVDRSAEKKEECYSRAIKTLKSKINGFSKESGIKNISFPNSNDVNGKDEVVSLVPLGNVATSCKLTLPSGSGWSDKSDSCSYSNNLGIKNVCINAKTGEVKYNNNAECSGDYMKVSESNLNGKKLFSYFLPLNLKSDDSFALSFDIDDDGTYNGKSYSWCVDRINNYNNYDLDILLIDKNGKFKRFSGNNRRNDKLMLDNCKNKSSECCTFGFLINHENKFYDVSSGSINGFNFYYRPIDIDNPFPNGVSNENSLWYDYYHGLDTDYSIKFGDNTYTSTSRLIENVDNIADNYFDWHSISLNGKSNRIDGSGNEVVAVSEGVRNVFMLGSGPLVGFEDGEVCSTKKAIKKNIKLFKPCIN